MHSSRGSSCARSASRDGEGEPFAEYLNKLFGTEGPKIADLDLFEWKEIYK
jgi:hypothetical protein